MVGGKLDLESKRDISKEKALELCKKYNLLDYIECSAKSGENIGEVFNIIVEAIGKRKALIK